jgi:hypothetical protein
MNSNYEKIIRQNLTKIYQNLSENLDKSLPAINKESLFYFRAFGEDCCLGPEGITLSGKSDKGPKGLLISLYANHTNPDPVQLEPFQSFKDLPGSMPYQGAFSSNSEKILVPHVLSIKDNQQIILDTFQGERAPQGVAGDLAFILYPLPKIAVCYIFYLPDEEFPASTTCLFSANALSFMPLDGLADVAEYTSKSILILLANT